MANTNLFLDGNFDSTSNLYTYATTYALTPANHITLTLDGADSQAILAGISVIMSSEITGHKIYARANMMTDNSTCDALYMRIGTYGGGGTPETVDFESEVVSNTTYTLSGIVTVPVDYTAQLGLRLEPFFGSSDIAIGKTVYVSYALMVDLTAEYGAGNEPELATCDAWDWWDGEQGTIPVLTASQHGTHIDISWTT